MLERALQGSTGGGGWGAGARDNREGPQRDSSELFLLISPDGNMISYESYFEVGLISVHPDHMMLNSVIVL